MTPTVDIAIAGGGMVGASLACALAQLPLRVAVVERVPFDNDAQPSFDLRTTALSRTSQCILDSLGIWGDVADCAAPIRRIHVSERGRFGTTVIEAAREGLPALGYVLENRRLGKVLWERLAAADNVQLLAPAGIDDATPAADHIAVHVAADGGDQELAARLLVVADGARSQLRAVLGIAADTRPYGQTAIIGTTEVTKASDGETAYERFTPDGPMAVLPAGDGRYVFVLTQADAAVDETLALDDQAFCELLQRRFGHRLGRFQRVGQRVAYPLALTQSRELTAQRAAIVGNAAHGLHPVAGQGYNLGLRDAATLAELIADDLRDGAGDPGAPALLQAYVDWRHRDQRNVVAFTDGLIRLFDLPAGALGGLRGLGLAAFDMVPGAKSALARTTMGLGGRLTRLARGLPL
ncbi:MAG: 2-octaprenyl-6-methoxyphenyl hydroxylase [Chromatiales bacterium]|nr:MAG: 2-octaprenyl-6-methoxyphenyl hydroxylase [Chromatiales bacterium]